MYRVPGGYPQATPQSPRSLHFRGRHPIPQLPKLASSCARPAAALRDQLVNVAVDAFAAFEVHMNRARTEPLQFRMH